MPTNTKFQPFKMIDLAIALPGRVGHVEEVSLWSCGRGRRKRGRESSGGSGANAARAIARETETRDENVKDDEHDGSSVQFFDHVDVLAYFLLYIVSREVTPGGQAPRHRRTTMVNHGIQQQNARWASGPAEEKRKRRNKIW